MSRTVADLELAVTKPQETTSAFTVPSEDIQGLDTEERAQDAMDGGSVTIDNTDRTYTDDHRITSGDRVDIRAQLADEDTLSTRLVTIARDVTDTLDGGGIRSIDVELTDFVFTILSWRSVSDSYESEDVGTIIDELVGAAAPEVGRSQIETFGVETDAFINGRYLLDVLVEDLSPIGDAILAHEGTDLIAAALEELDVSTTLTPADLYAPINVTRTDDEVVNRVRIDGGVAHAVDAEQSTQSSTTRVTNTNRLVTQIPARKSELARIQLYTQRDPNSTDRLSVRLQAERDGEPVDIDDRESDITRRTHQATFLSDDGWTTFLLPDHSLPPASEPFLIIEAGGGDGHDVGVDGSGTPTYQAEYPYPLIAQTVGAGSQSEYRRRDHRIRDDQLETLSAVQYKVESVARHRARPARKLTAAAKTPRAHQLQPGQVARVSDFPDVGANGEYLCLDRKTTYDGIRMTTELTLQSARSI